MPFGILRTFTLLLVLSIQPPLVPNLECFECSSLYGDDCEKTESKVTTCTNGSTGCLKLTLEPLSEDRRMVYNKHHEDNEYYERILVPQYTEAVVKRSCSESSNTSLLFIATPTCKQVLDYAFNITLCMCITDYCNGSTKLYVNCYVLLFPSFILRL